MGATEGKGLQGGLWSMLYVVYNIADYSVNPLAELFPKIIIYRFIMQHV